MALLSLNQPLPSLSVSLSLFSASSSSSSKPSSVNFGQTYIRSYVTPSLICSRRTQGHVVRMAPEEEKMTRRSPLDFPIEWERPKPGRRPDIFPQFSPMKTPLPPPLPADPPEEDEEEEEKKEEEEEDPEKEETDKPEEK